MVCRWVPLICRVDERMLFNTVLALIDHDIFMKLFCFMVKIYYRGMAEQNGKPKTGRGARLLGVRPTIDINIEQVSMGCLNKEGYLLPESQREFQGEFVTIAIRDTKGMSVSLSIESLPIFRKPTQFGGKGKDPL